MAVSKNKFIIAQTWAEVKEAVKNCKKTKYCSHDFETNGRPFYEQDFWPTIIGLSYQPGSSVVIPLNHPESRFQDNDEWLQVLDYICEHLIINPDVIKIGWNLAYEGKVLKRYGWEYRGRCFDGMLAKHLLDEERPHGLGDVTNSTLIDFSGFKDETEKLARQFGWAKIPLEPLAQRNALDTDITLRLMIRYEHNLKKHGLYKLFRNLVMPLRLDVLNRMEYRGIDIDAKYLLELENSYLTRIEAAEGALRSLKCVRRYEKHRKRETLRAMVEELEAKIEALEKEGGKESQIRNAQKRKQEFLINQFVTKKDQERLSPFNFGSGKQLADFLFYSKRGLGLEIVKYTKNKETKKSTETASVDEEVMLALKEQDDSGFIEKLLHNRDLNHLYSTYVKGIIARMGTDNRVHASFLVHGTVTGRLSSKDPNLQNIPRGTTASDIKKMYIPPKGYLLMELDYSQAELRLVAEMSGDDAMIEIFKRDYNIHVATAAKVNKVDYNFLKNILKDENHPDWEKWEVQKKFAKTINFGILYGETEYKLASQLGITVDEAKEFMNTWFESYPKVTKWIKDQHKFARKNGYVTNVFGRKRRLPDAMYTEKEARQAGIFGFHLEAMRQSVNAPIQGGSSDLTQFSAVIAQAEKKRGNLPQTMEQVYTVHDSLGYIIKPEDIHKTVPKMLEICNNPNTEKYFGFQMKDVRMKVSVEIGKSWGDLKDYDAWEKYQKWV
ncbi:DNA polymerase [Flavobacterium sp.]|jgi:DNA polymerase-1|uniref:DNA polymerase n=1 Tax=Flavobacterium sp. TaxID=239 RepID=UPI0037C1900C